MKERLSVYTWVIIIVVVIIAVIVAAWFLMPKVTKSNKEKSEIVNLSGDEFVDEDESGLKTNISSKLNETRDIGSDLEVTNIELTSQNKKSIIKIILTNNSNEDKEKLLLEIRVRSSEDKDVKIIRCDVDKITSGEEKEVVVNVEGDISNAKDIIVKNVQANRI